MVTHRLARVWLPVALVIALSTGFALPVLAAPNENASDKAAGSASTAKAPAAEEASTEEAPAPAPAPKPATPASKPAKTAPPKAQSSNAGGAAASHSDEGGTDTSGSTGQGDGPTSGSDGVNCDGSANSDTGHGANQGSTYDNTCPTSGPAPNGNGGGGSKGKPCAGCVGNADDKNPPGQEPGPNDHNRGYECEHREGHPWNKGIGKGNPAHTGCEPGEEPPGEAQVCHIEGGEWSVITIPESELGSHLGHGDTVYTGDPCEDEEPPETCPDGTPLPPNGVCEPDDEDPRVLPKIIRRPATPKAGVLGKGPVRAGALPFTGGNLAPFVILSLTLFGSGGAAVVRSRKRR